MHGNRYLSGAIIWAIALMPALGNDKDASGEWLRTTKRTPVEPTLEKQETRPIDLVICLDTSGSMTNLIDSARGRIWDLVTELSKARPTPRLRVGLLTFGSPETSTAEQGWVVRQTDLTGDLDTVYGKMMELTTQGGDEYVGWVLSDAVNTMSWSGDSEALRLIFVAGNESADQGPNQYDFRNVAREARSRDILINSIFAGNRDQGIRELWAEVADHGGGKYAAIDMAYGTSQIATPHDSALEALNQELNATYIPYGAKGAEGLANQLAQDANAGKLGVESCSSRVAAKGCGLYNNAPWDLVDAIQQEGFKLADIKREALPEPMRSMTLEQRANFVEGMRAVRSAIQEEIQETNEKRRLFIRETRMRNSTGQLSLDDAILQSLRLQARAKGFAFSEQTQVPIVSVPAPEETVPWLKPSIIENIDALLATLPALHFRVGMYETKDEGFATLMATHAGEKINYVVGDERYRSKRPALVQLVQLLESESNMLQTVQVVQTLSSPFPYAEARGSGAGLQAKVPRYLLGGISFGDRATADVAAMRVGKAVAELGKAHGRRMANRAGGQAGDKVITLVVHSDDPRVEPLEALKYFEKKIRTITATAGRAYMELVDGC